MTEDVDEATQIKTDLDILLSSAIEKGILDRASFEIMKGKALKQLSKQSTIPSSYMPMDVAYVAYIYILDNGGTAEEALDYAASVYDKPIEFIKEVKNKRFFYSKDIVDMANNHPKQMQMIKNRTIDKSALEQSKTANQQLRRLSKYRSIDDEIESLKEKDKEQQEEIDTLSLRLSETQAEIEILKQYTGVEDMPPKDKASFLKQRGHTQKEVADSVGKSLRTIKSWWKDL